MISNTWTRKFVSIWVAAAIMIVYSVVITATPALLTGSLSVVGDVRVDGQKVTSGGTFFSDSTIVTAADSSAILSLGKLGRIEILPNSSLNLTLGDNVITGMMNSGRGRVSTPAGVAVNIATKDGAVKVDGSEATSFNVNTENVSTIVATESGLAELNSGAVVNVVAAGENGVAGVYPPQQFIARLTTTGNRPITINGASAVGGAAILTGATIETPDQVGATINLGSLGELDVAPNTLLTLEFDQNGNVKVTLKRGCTILRTRKNVNATIETEQGVAATNDKNKGGRSDVCFPLGAAQPTVNQGAAQAAGAGAGSGVAGGGLSGGVIAGLVAAIGVATGVIIYQVVKDDPIVSPSK
ncbi:MAG: hypothetical protein ABR577_18605 [Pyrinomonadaceae bacterium]